MVTLHDKRLVQGLKAHECGCHFWVRHADDSDGVNDVHVNKQTLLEWMCEPPAQQAPTELDVVPGVDKYSSCAHVCCGCPVSSHDMENGIFVCQNCNRVSPEGFGDCNHCMQGCSFNNPGDAETEPCNAIRFNDTAQATEAAPAPAAPKKSASAEAASAADKATKAARDAPEAAKMSVVATQATNAAQAEIASHNVLASAVAGEAQTEVAGKAQAEAVVQVASGAMWKCVFCTSDNPALFLQCQGCRNKRSNDTVHAIPMSPETKRPRRRRAKVAPSAKSASSGKQALVHEAAMWRCGGCTLKNAEMHLQCSACRRQRFKDSAQAIRRVSTETKPQLRPRVANAASARIRQSPKLVVEHSAKPKSSEKKAHANEVDGEAQTEVAGEAQAEEVQVPATAEQAERLQAHFVSLQQHVLQKMNGWSIVGDAKLVSMRGATGQQSIHRDCNLAISAWLGGGRWRTAEVLASLADPEAIVDLKFVEDELQALRTQSFEAMRQFWVSTNGQPLHVYAKSSGRYSKYEVMPTHPVMLQLDASMWHCGVQHVSNMAVDLRYHGEWCHKYILLIHIAGCSLTGSRCGATA